MLKTVIILANTEKRYGRCIAGIDAKSGLPIRLVTANTADDAVPARYCTFSDGRMCEKLDVVRLACEEPDSVATKAIHNTHPCQPENTVLDMKTMSRMKFVRKATIDEVLHLYREERSIGLMGTLRRYGFWSDSIPYSDALCRPDKRSLRLVKVNDLSFLNSNGYRARFKYMGNNYTLKLKDTKFPPAGKYKEAHLFLSLGERFTPTMGENAGIPSCYILVGGVLVA